MRNKLFLFVFLFAVLAIVDSHAFERKKYNFNSEWRLQIGDFPEAKQSQFDDSRWKAVTLPHAFNEDEAFKVSIEQLTDTVVWYRKHFRIPASGKKQKVFIEFEGVRQAGDFYLNGQYLGKHENGVMAAGFDLTPYIKEGDNVLAVRTDNDWMYREKSTNSKFQWNDRNFNANYGGLPKNVFLYVTDEVYQTLPLYSNLKTTGVYIYAKDIDVKGRTATIHAESEVKNDSREPRQFSYQVVLLDADGKQVKSFEGEKVTLQGGETRVVKAASKVNNLHFWSWGYGYLYTVQTILKDNKNQVFDEVSTRTGFRKTRFAEGKIWLNDRVIQMKGYAQKIEYLAKGRFWNLLRDTIGCTDYPGYPTQYYGPLDMREESIEGMFRIQDRQKINRIRDEHGGNRMVRWMQYSDETGQKISKETVQWMIKNKIEPSGIRGLEKYMSPQKIMNYIERQKKEQYAGMTAEAVLEEYKDYLSMCEACCKNMADEMVYRPRELKRRHDEVVVDRQQIQILKELENNAEGKEAYAQEMRQKF